MPPLQIPNFSTLNTPPSWLNAKGGIDRSACVEVGVKEVRRLARCVIIDQSRRDSRGRPLHIVSPLPNEKPAIKRFAARPGQRGSNGGGNGSAASRLATGVFTINAASLHHLHQTRMPRRLAGDFRTARANAMRDERSLQSKIQNPKSKLRFKSRVTRAQPIAWPPDRNLSANPNKGAARSKMIGLPETWRQPLRLEKWTYPRRIRPVYFLICPGHFHRGARGERGDEYENRWRPKSRSLSACSALSAVNALPGLSTRPPGREHPSTKKCPQRCLKLLMVQCTPAEYRDAKLAQLWINSLPSRLRLREPYHAHTHRLIARYGILFQPRVLLCPRCVGRCGIGGVGNGEWGGGGGSGEWGGVKYGNNPETVRQGWRRRHNKPDTSIARNVLRAPVQFDHWMRYEYEFHRMRMNEGRTRKPKPKPKPKPKREGDSPRRTRRRSRDWIDDSPGAGVIGARPAGDPWRDDWGPGAGGRGLGADG